MGTSERHCFSDVRRRWIITSIVVLVHEEKLLRGGNAICNLSKVEGWSVLSFCLDKHISNEIVGYMKDLVPINSVSPANLILIRRIRGHPVYRVVVNCGCYTSESPGTEPMGHRDEGRAVQFQYLQPKVGLIVRSLREKNVQDAIKDDHCRDPLRALIGTVVNGWFQPPSE